MEGSGVEFEANDGKYEDGKGDEEANLSENTSRDDKEKDGESEFHLHTRLLTSIVMPICLITQNM